MAGTNGSSIRIHTQLPMVMLLWETTLTANAGI